MGKSGKKRRKKRIGYNHLGMFGISLIVLILMLSLMAQSRNLQESLAGYETRAEALSQQIEDEKARTEEIEALKEYMLTDEYTEEAAREKLGLVKENEIIFQEEEVSEVWKFLTIYFIGCSSLFDIYFYTYPL